MLVSIFNHSYCFLSLAETSNSSLTSKPFSFTKSTKVFLCSAKSTGIIASICVWILSKVID
ncbi:hypothetical protein AZ021_003767, partial [Enterobacter ludwigii]